MVPNNRIHRVTLVSVLGAVVGCSGGSSTSPTPSAPAPLASANVSSAAPRPLYYDAAIAAGARYVGPAKFRETTIDVALAMNDVAGLRRYALAASTPGSPSYRQFLSPSQIADRFGASSAAQARATAYFTAFGLRVGGWSQRMMLSVTGPQAALERAFHTTFGAYVDARGATVLAPTTAPTVPDAVPIVAALDIARAIPQLSSSVVQGPSNGRLGGLSPQQIAAAFDYTGAYAAGFTGSGIRVGIIGTGPVSTPAPGHVGDVEAFKSAFGVGGSSAVSVIAATDADLAGNAASGFATPPPVTASSATCSNVTGAGASAPGYYPAISPTAGCNPEDDEAQLDTQQVAGLARDAMIDFYLAYNPDDQCYDSSGNQVFGTPCPAPGSGTAGSNGGPGYALQGLAEVDEEMQSAIHRNSSDIVSMSFGSSETSLSEPGVQPPSELDASGHGLLVNEIAALAAEGVAVFASSGDQGAEACQGTGPSTMADVLCNTYPATDPNVVAVGGVTTPVDSSGTLTAPFQAWGLSTNAGFDASGGGTSSIFALPAYQSGVAGVVGSMRNTPDIALEGDPKTGVATVLDADPSLGGATYRGFGGTSVAAPEAAAMWALVLQACKATPACSTGSGSTPYRLGEPNPLFYAIYGGTGALPYASVFSDVTFGDNALYSTCATGQNACPSPAPPALDPGYAAGVGYDNVTGLGIPFARHLIRAVAGV